MSTRFEGWFRANLRKAFESPPYVGGIFGGRQWRRKLPSTMLDFMLTGEPWTVTLSLRTLKRSAFFPCAMDTIVPSVWHIVRGTGVRGYCRRYSRSTFLFAAIMAIRPKRSLVHLSSFTSGLLARLFLAPWSPNVLKAFWVMGFSNLSASSTHSKTKSLMLLLFSYTIAIAWKLMCGWTLAPKVKATGATSIFRP